MDLLKSCVLSDSVAHDLYIFFLHKDNNRTLAGRVAEYCNMKNVNLSKYIMCDDYAKSIKDKLIRDNIMVEPSVNGVVDSIKYIIYNGYDSYSHMLLKYLLNAF